MLEMSVDREAIMTDEAMIDRVAAAIRGAMCPVEGYAGTSSGDLAHAAIEAMREPDKAMIEAGATAAEDALDSDYDSGPDGESHHVNTYLRSDAPAAIWKAMLGKALA